MDQFVVGSMKLDPLIHMTTMPWNGITSRCRGRGSPSRRRRRTRLGRSPWLRMAERTSLDHRLHEDLGETCDSHQHVNTSDYSELQSVEYPILQPLIVSSSHHYIIVLYHSTSDSPLDDELPDGRISPSTASEK
uniref:Uncharacterized protein n=1 Tax=Steinernema glaseri TaxID=37863 RepID=A0A1I7ZAA1_9BILA